MPRCTLLQMEAGRARTPALCPTVHIALHVYLLGHPGEAPNTSGHPWQASLVHCQTPNWCWGGLRVPDVKEAVVVAFSFFAFPTGNKDVVAKEGEGSLDPEIVTLQMMTSA